MTHWVEKQGQTYDPSTAKKEFGVGLHIMRTFKFKAGILESEKKWVEKGGLLWYGFQPKKWSFYKNEDEFKKTVKPHCEAIASLKPAKVLFAPGWEPDGHVEPYAKKHEDFGTSEDYREFRHATKKLCDSLGAKNAIYVMDYSMGPTFNENNAKVIKDMWPRDGQVGWLFWNFFEFTTCASEAMFKKKGKETKSCSAKEMNEWFYNYFTKNSGDWDNIPWGFGAFGSAYETNASPPWQKKIPIEERRTF